ncbi:MAG: hypothetical protein ACRC4P_05360 [Aeromonas sp.]
MREKGLAGIGIAIVNRRIIGVRLVLKMITSAGDGTPVSSVPLKIINPREKLGNTGIESVHFLGCGVKLGRMLAQQNPLLNEGGTKRI